MNFKEYLYKKNPKIKIKKYLSEEEIKRINQNWETEINFFLKLRIKKLLKLILKFFNIKYYLNKSRKISNVLEKYDNISGGYIKRYEDKNHDYVGYWSDNKVAEISGLPIHQVTFFLSNFIREKKLSSFMEVGAGELTTMQSLFEFLDEYKINNSAAIDLSFKRVQVGKKFAEKNNTKINIIARSNAEFLPFESNKFDLVYTNYCLEQVPDLFDKIVNELIRVSRKYIILIEPSFEFSEKYSKNKILIKNYPIITNNSFENKNCKLIFREPMSFSRYINRSEIVILEKKFNNNQNHTNLESGLVCPISKQKLFEKDGFYLTEDKRIKYPIKDGIPLLANFDAIYL